MPQMQITDVGFAAILTAQGGGVRMAIETFKVGDTIIPYVPSNSDTDIHGSSVYSGNISSIEAVGSDYLLFSCIVPANISGNVGEIGLFLDTGELVAIGIIDPYLNKTSGSSLRLNCVLFNPDVTGTVDFNVSMVNSVPKVTDYADLPDPVIASNDLFVVENGRLNTFSKLEPVVMSRHQIALVWAPSTGFELYEGVITNITNGSFTIPSNPSINSMYDLGCISVVSGVGAGQTRRVTVSNGVFNLEDGNWDTNPNGASIILLKVFLSERVEEFESIVKPGSVMATMSAAVPDGWLECDGSSLLRTAYDSLYGIVGVTYGNVDASHFNLPDLRGRFLRGWDHLAGRDPNAASRTNRGDGTAGDNIGTIQEDDFKSHTHTSIYNEHGQSGTNSRIYENSGTLTDIMNNLTGGDETRPKNINVMYIIKY